MVTAIARFTHRFALWVVVLWVLAVGGANFVVPQLQQVLASQNQLFLPNDSVFANAVQRSSAAFYATPSDNVGYLVLQRDGPLTASDRGYYDQLIAALRGDADHVIQVVDWWGSPLTQAAAVSRDQHVATAPLRLTGSLGDLQADSSITAVRAVVTGQPPPDGLAVYVTGPGAAMVDQFAALDRQLVLLTAIAAGAVVVLLLIAYRNLFTVLVPVVSVGLSLAAARAGVAALGGSHSIGVSRLAVALGAVMILGGGAGFTVILLGRYHELRREGLDSQAALIDAYRKVVPLLVGSALTLTVALSFLNFTRIGLFRDTGVPLTIAVLAVALGAATLAPAMIALLDRVNLLKPPPQWWAQRWRRISVTVARWPSRVLIAGAIFMFLLAIPLRGLQFEWDEGAAAPVKSESARGYAAVNHHFAHNHLLPDIITIETSQDVRNPNGLLQIEQITGALMNIPGITMVQSASRLNGALPSEATMTVPAGALGDSLEEISVNLAAQPQTLDDIATSLDDIISSLDSAQDGLQRGVPGLTQVSTSARQMKAAANKLGVSVRNFAGAFSSLPKAVEEIPRCLENPVCFAVQGVVQWAKKVVDASLQLADGVAEVANGLTATTQAMGGSSPINFDPGAAIAKVQQARAAADALRQLMNANGHSIRDSPGYLHNLALMCRGTPGVGLNAAMKALDDPAAAPVLDGFVAPGGHAARLFVYGDSDGWAGEASQRTGAYVLGVNAATKGSAIQVTGMQFTGVGPAIQDLQKLEGHDVLVLGALTLGVVLLVSGMLLRSPVGALINLGIVAATYVSSLGASIVIWQYLLGHKLHWVVLPISFVVLLTVSAGYNLQLALRIREELPIGQHIAAIRALGATGATLTTAGIIVAATMFALGGSSVLSLAQVGVTVGIGALLNTLVVRRYLLPAISAWMGHSFWWPRPIIQIRWVPGSLVDRSTAGRP